MLAYIKDPSHTPLKYPASKAKERASESDYQDIIKIVASYVTKDKRGELEQWLQHYDTDHSGSLELSSLQKVFMKMEIPLPKIDVYTVYKRLREL